MPLAHPASATGKIPPLQNGDRLTRVEFERRFDTTSNLQKAELIEGVVYMSPPPVSFEEHGGPHFDVIGWLSLYRMMTPGVLGGDNASIRLDMDNLPQPDAFLMLLPEYGGQARIGADGYIEGAPELVVEIAASSVSYDMHAKLNAYRRNGVREYVVWRVQERAIDWFLLRDGKYEALPLDSSGLYRSEVFPGLQLNANALLRGDMATVAQTQQQGFTTPEYASFLANLQTKIETADERG